MSVSVCLCVKQQAHLLWVFAHQLLWFTDLSRLQVLDYAIEADQLIEKYETLASELLQWIEQTIVTLNDRQLANSLSAVQNQLQAFNSYRTVEKPPKWGTESWVNKYPKYEAIHCIKQSWFFHRFTEKGNLEVLLFTIQSKMRANNQKVYMPREGKLISDINKVWLL